MINVQRSAASFEKTSLLYDIAYRAALFYGIEIKQGKIL